MLVALLTPAMAALVPPRCGLVHMAAGLNPSSSNDRAAVAARAAAARYPGYHSPPGSGGKMSGAEAKRKWVADRNAEQRRTQRGDSTSPPADRAAVATEGRRRLTNGPRYPVPPVYSPPGSGGAMSDAEAKQAWSAQRSATQRAARRDKEPSPVTGEAADVAPTTAASAAVDPAVAATEAVDPAPVGPAAPAAGAPAAAPPDAQPTTHAAHARAAAARYPTSPIYAPTGSGGAMTDAEAKRKWSAERSAEQRRAERGV